MVSKYLSNRPTITSLLIVGALILSPALLPQTTKTVSTNFVQMSFPRGVELLVPRDWKVFEQQWKDAVQTSDKAVASLLGVGLPEGKRMILFAANSVPAETYASIGISSTMPPSISPAEITALTPAEIRELKAESLQMWQKTLAAQKVRLLSLDTVTVQTLAGYQALITEYRRSNGQSSSSVKVQINRIFTPTQEIMLTLSYREDEASLWVPVLARIRSSLRLGHNK